MPRRKSGSGSLTPNDELPHATVLEPWGINQSRKRGGLLSAARVIKEEPWERLAPVLEHANERATGEVLCNFVLSHKLQAYAIKRGADHDLDVVDDQGPIDRNREGLSALLELHR